MSQDQKLALPHRLVLVTLQPRSGIIDVNEWMPRFNLSTDWYRYAPNCWLLWTSGTPESWTAYLRTFIGADDAVLVADLTDNRFVGVLPQGAWKWLAKYIQLKDPVP